MNKSVVGYQDMTSVPVKNPYKDINQTLKNEGLLQ